MKKMISRVKTLLFVMLAAIAAEANAQTERFSPYGFVQLQGGVGTTFTNVNQFDIMSPTFTLGFGAMLIPEFGARINVNGWESKGGFASTSETYKFNYFNADVDLILNVFNIFSRKYSRPFDLSIVAGIGINHAWNNDISDIDLTQVGENTSNVWGSGLKQKRFNGTSFRVGVMGDFRLSKNWKLGLEVDMNAMSDDWNAKFQQNNRDWMLTTQLSLTYRFGLYGKRKVTQQQPVTTPTPAYTEQQPQSQPQHGKPTTLPTINPPRIAEVPFNEVITYTIRETDMINASTIIQKAADWSKNHENGTLLIKGYADKGTGTPALNMEYSQQRADKVAAALKELGVPASKITVKAYGDTEQPFTENSQNRCVIIMGR